MTAPTRSRRWLKWLALAVGALLIVVIGSGVWNYQHPLTREKLDAARDLWKAKGPRDYTLRYTVRNHNTEGDRFVVKVQAGKAVEALVNGQKEPADRLTYYGMERLFDYIDEFLRHCERKKKDGQQTAFHRGSFHRETGALRTYGRKMLGEPQWVEIRVEAVE